MKTVYFCDNPNHPDIPPGATVIQYGWEWIAFRMRNPDEEVEVRAIDWPIEIPKREVLEGPLKFRDYGGEDFVCDGYVDNSPFVDAAKDDFRAKPDAQAADFPIKGKPRMIEKGYLSHDG